MHYYFRTIKSSSTCANCLVYSRSSFSISFNIFAILSCALSILWLAIIAFLLPFAPACANPLKTPNTTILSPAIISAPLFTSPNITILPSTSILCPDLIPPCRKYVSEV